jgi:hypothetical protein
MSDPAAGPAPVGVRPMTSPFNRPAPGAVMTRLRWVQPGSLVLQYGDRVVVGEGEDAWLGEVVVPVERLLEWPGLAELPDLPLVVRRAEDAEWPAPPDTAGRRLLESLALPPELLVRSKPGSAAGPFVASSGSAARETTQDDRGDQERGRDQRERE